jgi:hypothetical protein
VSARWGVEEKRRRYAGAASAAGRETLSLHKLLLARCGSRTGGRWERFG